MKAYSYSFIIAILTSIIGIICLQQGIKYSGATTDSILSMFEPVTSSVIFGIIILHERLTIVKASGCLIILGAVIGLIVSNSKKEE